MVDQQQQQHLDQWVILELGPKAEGEDPDLVRQSIRHSIRDAEVFIPASVTQMGEDRVVQYLVEGYAFVKRKHPDQTYFRLENTKYVHGVLREPISVANGRPVKRIAVISDAEIEKFRRQIRVEVDQGISVGDMVLITSGPYRQITARVEEEIAERDAVQVYIRLRSKEAIITLPRACLRLISKAPRSPVRDRTTAVREWLQGAWKVLGWPKDEVTHVLLPYETYLRLGDWLLRGRERVRFITSFDVPLEIGPLESRLRTFDRTGAWLERIRAVYQGVTAFATPLDVAPILRRAEEWGQLSRWFTYQKKLYSSIGSAYHPLPPSSRLETKYLDLLWFHDVFARLDAIRSTVDAIERAIRTGGKSMTQNLIIDGTQLAIRCATAPGLSSLSDSKGRPTGAIIGFLNSLGSLKKRFSSAIIHVTWDGSSQRRRRMYDGYKANRSSRQPVGFEIDWLRANLPKFGVHQAYNPEEEADDVIATLVRGSLKGQSNVILSTDRDLLQLVTATDHQLVPAVGAGKEKLYDVDAVSHEYGVTPDFITSVRAISGDTSDNIPGATGIGLKTASKLVKLYDSLDRLFASNLAGLTKAQYGNLRAAEKQVKLNLELMRLHCDLPLTLFGPDPDQMAARERLLDVDVKPDPILAAFFAPSAGSSAHV